MNVLLFENRPTRQDKLLEVLSWFRLVKRVTLASEAEIDHRKPDISAIIVGSMTDMSRLEAIKHIRRGYPGARLIATIDDESPFEDEQSLVSAGADGVLDTRMSLWKTGLVLRQILWLEAPPRNDTPYLSTPRLQSEAV